MFNWHICHIPMLDALYQDIHQTQETALENCFLQQWTKTFRILIKEIWSMIHHQFFLKSILMCLDILLIETQMTYQCLNHWYTQLTAPWNRLLFLLVHIHYRINIFLIVYVCLNQLHNNLLLYIITNHPFNMWHWMENRSLFCATPRPQIEICSNKVIF